MDLCDEWASDDDDAFSSVSTAAAKQAAQMLPSGDIVVHEIDNKENAMPPLCNIHDNIVQKIATLAIRQDASTNTDSSSANAERRNKPQPTQQQQRPNPFNSTSTANKIEEAHSPSSAQPAKSAGGGHQMSKPSEPVLYVPPQPPHLDEEVFGQEIQCGQNFGKYSNIPVKVSGEHIPPPIDSFASSGLAELLLGNVRKSGYTVPTPIQKHGIAAVLAGRDLMACAQTGSGKTAAFLLGILHRLLTDEAAAAPPAGSSAQRVADRSAAGPQAIRPLAVIITPTRELAVQIFNEARKFARDSYLRTCVLYGGTSVNYQLQQLQTGCHVLVATPGRLLDFVDAGCVRFERLRFLVMDEADRMLDMGFLPDMQQLMQHESMEAPVAGAPAAERRRQTLMFSATFPQEIQELAGRMLSAYVFVAVGIVGGACEDVQQTVVQVARAEKRDRLLVLLEKERREGGGEGGTMVFVATRRLADFLATYLCELGLPVTSIHGDRYQEQREQALGDFRQQRMQVLICTSVAARGLNIKNVQHVINYDMPNSIDDYVHRIGRTGRMGNQGRATTFFDPDADAVLASDLCTILEQAQQHVPAFLLQQARCFGPAVNGERMHTRRTDFGGFDMRQFRAQRRRDAAAGHEPTVKW